MRVMVLNLHIYGEVYYRAKNDLANRGFWHIGDGTTVQIYHDQWLLSFGSLKILSPPLLGDQAYVSDLMTILGA